MTEIKKAKCCGTCNFYDTKDVDSMCCDENQGCDLDMGKAPTPIDDCDKHEWKTENGMDSGG